MSVGFLVVLVESGEFCSRNPLYDGVDRTPPYAPALYSTHFPEEESALDDYVFGDCLDSDSNLIPSYSKAAGLLERFKVSRRQYEILLCSTALDDSTLVMTKA